MRNKINHILLILLAGSALSANSFAAEPTVNIAPKKIVPGGLMVVTVQSAAGKVEGSFRGKQLHFNRAKSASAALTGIDLNTEPGIYTLALTVDGKALSRDVTI